MGGFVIWSESIFRCSLEGSTHILYTFCLQFLVGNKTTLGLKSWNIIKQITGKEDNMRSPNNIELIINGQYIYQRIIP